MPPRDLYLVFENHFFAARHGRNLGVFLVFVPISECGMRSVFAKSKFPAFKSSSKVRRDKSVVRFSHEFKLCLRQLVNDILRLRLRNL